MQKTYSGNQAIWNTEHHNETKSVPTTIGEDRTNTRTKINQKQKYGGKARQNAVDIFASSKNFKTH